MATSSTHWADVNEVRLGGVYQRRFAKDGVSSDVFKTCEGEQWVRDVQGTPLPYGTPVVLVGVVGQWKGQSVPRWSRVEPFKG